MAIDSKSGLKRRNQNKRQTQSKYECEKNENTISSTREINRLLPLLNLFSKRIKKKKDRKKENFHQIG